MTEKNPTDILRKEHEKVLEILDMLEEGMKNKDTSSMAKNIAVLEKEFDKHSLNKEEKALFPELEKFIPMDDGPTGVMIMEHKELAGLIKNFKEKLKIKDFNEVSLIGNSIISTLRQHIDKENNMLFMIADMHLNNKQKKTILDKFKKFDTAGND